MSKTMLSADEALAKARQLAKAGNLQAALGLYQQILDKSPGNKKARKEFKVLQQKAANQGGAAQMQAQLQRLMELYSSGNIAEALRQAKQSCKLFPEQPLPFNITGAILAGKGDHTAASRYFRQALEIAPDYIDALNNLGASLHKLGQFEEAVHCYRQLLNNAQAESDPELHFNLGNVLKSAGQLEEATHHYEKSLTLRPLYLPAHLQLGHVYHRLARPEQAITCFRNAINLDKQCAEAYSSIGDAHAWLQDLEAAQEWYREALKISPRFPQANLGLGKVLLHQGRNSEAAKALKRSLEEQPDSPEILHFLRAAEDQAADRAPRDYVADMFDGFSATFEDHLTGPLGYDAPGQLRQMVDGCELIPDRKIAGVDLGCGTGLVGAVFADLCDSLTGIDLSPRMIEKAREKQVYSQLHVGDIEEVLTQLDTRFDLLISADTLIYTGDLQSLMACIARHSQPGALFAFTTELGQDQDIRLLPTGRFCHSDSYVQRMMEVNDFSLLQSEILPLRVENGEWLKGGFYLCRAREA